MAKEQPIGAYPVGALWDIGAYELLLTIPVGVAGGWSEGTRLTADGAILSILVAADYAEQAGDSYIRGSRHDANGYMYVTIDTPGGSEVLINGIAHSASGVRYVQNVEAINDWPEGFATDASGSQFYMTDSGTVAGYQSGVARASDGAVLLNS